jgi:predicted phosphodiesterase
LNKINLKRRLQASFLGVGCGKINQMKIAIISDIHDNLANLERFLAVFDGPAFAEGYGEAKGIICCGDVTTPETLEYLTQNFSGPIKLVCGNAEIRSEEFFSLTKRFPQLEVFAKWGEWKIRESKKSRHALDLAFVHKPDRVEEIAHGLVRQAHHKKFSFVFYGHTHQPWVKTAPKDPPLGTPQGESLGVTVIANPGTLGGVFTAPTFAVLDTASGRLELKKLY